MAELKPIKKEKKAKRPIGLAKGKFKIPKDFFQPLPLEEEATLYLPALPEYHKDPFDRMLICQAIVHGMVILTPDDLITQYPVRSIW